MNKPGKIQPPQQLLGRKELEQALQEYEARFQKLFEQAAVGVAWVDTGTGRFLKVNRKFCELTGYTALEMATKTFADLADPDDLLAHRTELDQVRQGLLSQYSMEMRLLRQDQGVVWVNLSVSPMWEPGEPDTAYVAVAANITDHKIAEEALAEESAINHYMAGLAATILKSISLQEFSELILEAAKQFTNSAYGFVSYIDRETGHMVSPTMTAEIWDQCRVGKTNNVFHEFKGLWGWVLEHGGPLLTNAPANDHRSTGTPEGHVPIERFLSVPAMVGRELLGQIALANAPVEYTTKDQVITERLATLYGIAIQRWHGERTLQQANDQLERRVEERTAELQLAHDRLAQAEKLSAIGKLSGSIAHEFNNPLFGIRNVLTGIQRRATMEEEDRKLLRMALEECDRMKDLIRSLQDFNSPTSGIMAPMDLHQALDSLLLLSRKEFENRKVKVVTVYAGKMPRIPAVADQIRQVFLNLLNNAAEALDDAGGTVTITTQCLANHTVAIHFQDSGCGMQPEVMAQVFEPFFSTKPGVKGTGLGLSVSYGIIKRHGGRIDITSEPGRGSTFSVILPLGPA